MNVAEPLPFEFMRQGALIKERNLATRATPQGAGQNARTVLIVSMAAAYLIEGMPFDHGPVETNV